MNRTLREQAREHGLCDKWYKEWDVNGDKQYLLDLYKKGLDFSLKQDWFSYDLIKANFPHELLLGNGIFLDHQVYGENMQTAIVLGSSDGELKYEGFVVGNVYARHTSKLSISVSDGAKVFIDCRDDCKVSVTCDGYSKVFVYHHGGEVFTEGNVTVREKEEIL